MRLLVATTNPGKLREYKTLLSGLDLDIVGLADIGVTTEVDETGSTYAENALLKARTYALQSGLLTLADDSGLEVDALNERPGLHSARYAPDSPTRIRKLLAELSDVPDDQRQARFQCVIALAWPDRRAQTTTGTCEGWIAREARGSNGFGFDPVFYMPEYGATMAELPEDFKNTQASGMRAAMKSAYLIGVS